MKRIVLLLCLALTIAVLPNAAGQSATASSRAQFLPSGIEPQDWD